MLVGVTPLPATELPVDRRSSGAVLAPDITARHTLPPWDDSAMDGYAVRSADVAGATAERPIALRVVGEIAAGHLPRPPRSSPGTAMRILTGAMLPAGRGRGRAGGGHGRRRRGRGTAAQVAVRVAVVPGTAIRPRGSDVRPGDRMLAAAAMSWPRIASGPWWPRDTARVPVHPRAAGRDPGDRRRAGARRASRSTAPHIPDSSSAALAAQVREAGADVIALGIARDDRDDIVERLRRGPGRSRTSWSRAAASPWVPTTRSGRVRRHRAHRPVAGRHPAGQAARLRSGAASGTAGACSCSGCRATR